MPSACGPGGFYNTGRCGGVYGPNYNLYPPFPPFQGVQPSSSCGQQQQGMQFNSHPYARSPRDFFMVD
jgi:hypothetical protein